MSHPRVFDNFLPDAEAVRREALAADFIDWQGPDGEVYRRICITEIPGLRERIEQVMGPVDMLGMAYRLNFGGEMPNAAVHSDLGWGTHALVLYLCDSPGDFGFGTAFWRHRATGAARIDPGDTELLQKIQGDWNDRDAWDMVSMIPMRFNRALIYEGANFHSRYPFEAFGTRPEDGRLICVAFFSPKVPR